MKNIMRFSILSIIFLLFGLLFSGCEKDDVANPPVLKSYTTSKTEEHATQNTKVVVVSNNIGGIIVTGWSVDTSMRAYMFNTIEASSIELANAHFNDIKFKYTIIGDTIFVSIETPSNTEEIIYKSSSLSLDIPYAMNCIISNVDGSIFLDQLSSTVTITNSAGEVNIERQEGSCVVSSSNNINVQMIVPLGGVCSLNTTNGNVSLSIPDSTHATVSLRTDQGTVTYTNLSFSQLSQTSTLLTGILGNGNSTITLYTKRGNILLNGMQ